MSRRLFSPLMSHLVSGVRTARLATIVSRTASTKTAEFPLFDSEELERVRRSFTTPRYKKLTGSGDAVESYSRFSDVLFKRELTLRADISGKIDEQQKKFTALTYQEYLRAERDLILNPKKYEPTSCDNGIDIVTTSRDKAKATAIIARVDGVPFGRMFISNAKDADQLVFLELDKKLLDRKKIKVATAAALMINAYQQYTKKVDGEGVDLDLLGRKIHTSHFPNCEQILFAMIDAVGSMDFYYRLFSKGILKNEFPIGSLFDLAEQIIKRESITKLLSTVEKPKAVSVYEASKTEDKGVGK